MKEKFPMKIRNILLATLLTAMSLAGLFCVGGTSESGNSRSVIVGSIVNVNGCVGSIPMKLIAEGYVPGSDTAGKVFSTSTNAQGGYRFEDVPKGLYYLNARCLGKKLLRGPIEITRPEEDLAKDSLCAVAKVTMRLPDTGTANVIFIKGTAESYVVADGSIVLDSVPSGDLTIVGFTKQGDVPKTLTSANSIQLTITMTPAGIVTAAFNNAPPTIIAQPGEFAKFVKLADSVYKTTIVANDPENDAIRFHVLSAPPGMTVDSVLGMIAWRPDLSIPLADYRVGVQVADVKGSSRSIWWTISVVESFTSGSDTIAPVIKLIGAARCTVAVGSPYADQGVVATDQVPGNPSTTNLSASITKVVLNAWGAAVQYNTFTKTLGRYTVVYRVSDAAGNITTDSTRSIFVIDASPLPQDTVAPVITLLGSPEIYLVFGVDSFVEPGYTATDNVDGNIKDNVMVSRYIRETFIGVDTLYYNVTDAAGNKAKTKTRVVHVVAPDTTGDPWPPEISLLGKARDTIRVGDTWVEPGYVVRDNRDTNGMGAKVVVTGTVDTRTVGFYRIEYNFTDSAGNAAPTKSRIIVVASAVIKDTVPPDSMFKRYGVPRSDALPSIPVKTYKDTIITDGPVLIVPDLANIKDFTMSWDLPNQQVNQFSLSLKNGVFMSFTASGTQYLLTQSFAAPQPKFSLSGSGIAKLDGEYYITADNVRCVWVKTDGSFAIVFK
jgi:hypothetical protein